MPGQEGLALEEPLLVGIDMGDGIQGSPMGSHQAVLYLDGILPHDVALIPAQQLVHLADSPGGAVFDGHHAVVRPALGHCLEHLFKGGQALAPAVLSKKTQGGHLAVCPRHALIDHPGSLHRLPRGGLGPPASAVSRTGIVPSHPAPQVPAAEGQHSLKQVGQL
jgi:hypothetical protein